MDPQTVTAFTQLGFAAGVASFLVIFVTRTVTEKLRVIAEVQNKIVNEMVAQTIYLSQILQQLGVNRKGKDE